MKFIAALFLSLTLCLLPAGQPLAASELGGANKAAETAPAAPASPSAPAAASAPSVSVTAGQKSAAGQAKSSVLASPESVAAWLARHSVFDLYEGIFDYKYGQDFAGDQYFEQKNEVGGRVLYVKEVKNQYDQSIYSFALETLRGKVAGFRLNISRYDYPPAAAAGQKYFESLRREAPAKGLQQVQKTLFFANGNRENYQSFASAQGAYVGFRNETQLAGRSAEHLLDPYERGLDGVAYGAPYSNDAATVLRDPNNEHSVVYQVDANTMAMTYLGLLREVALRCPDVANTMQREYGQSETKGSLSRGDIVISWEPGWLFVSNKQASQAISELAKQKADEEGEARLASLESKYKDAQGGYRSYKFGMSPAEVRDLVNKEFPCQEVESGGGNPFLIKPGKEFSTVKSLHLSQASGKPASSLIIPQHSKAMGASGLPSEFVFLDNKLVLVKINVQMGTEADIYAAIAEKYQGKEMSGTFSMAPDNRELAIMNSTDFVGTCMFGENEFNVVCAYTLLFPIDPEKAGTNKPNRLNRQYFVEAPHLYYADPAFHRAALQAAEEAGRAKQNLNKAIID